MKKIIPADKARDLVNTFGKELAPKVVDEIINALETYDDINDTFELQNMDGDFRYWEKVKDLVNQSAELWKTAKKVAEHQPKLKEEQK
jgi:hypothetical protein